MAETAPDIISEDGGKARRDRNHPVLSSFATDDVDCHLPAIAVVEPTRWSHGPDLDVLQPKIYDLLPPESGEKHERYKRGVARPLELIGVPELCRSDQ